MESASSSKTETSAAGSPPIDLISRLRAWLLDSLFIDPPPRRPLDARRIIVGALVALFGIVVILLRLGWSKPFDSVWAEDGAIFLSDALNRSAVDAVTTNYADYLHAVPRLLAEVVALAPIEWAPELLAVLGAAVVVLCAFIVWWASAAHLTDPILRAVLAAMVILLPVVGYESLANLAYVSWFMLFASFWLVLWRPPTLAHAAAAAVFVAMTIMSNPIGFFLVPLALLRLAAYRDLRDAAILSGVVAGALVQGIAIVFDDSPSPTPAQWDFELIPTFLLRVVGGLLLGQNGDAAVWYVAGRVLLFLLGVAFAVLVAIAVFRRSAPRRGLSVVAILLAVAVFFTVGYQRDLAETMMWPLDDATTTGARHTVFPVLLLLTVVLLQLQQRPLRISPPLWERVRRGALIAVAVVALVSFYVGNDFRFTPTWSSELEVARSACIRDPDLAVVPVAQAPVGWSAQIPCREFS